MIATMKGVTMKNINSYLASLAIALILVLSMLSVGLNALSAGSAQAQTQVTAEQAYKTLPGAER